MFAVLCLQPLFALSLSYFLSHTTTGFNSARHVLSPDEGCGQSGISRRTLAEKEEHDGHGQQESGHDEEGRTPAPVVRSIAGHDRHDGAPQVAQAVVDSHPCAPSFLGEPVEQNSRAWRPPTRGEVGINGTPPARRASILTPLRHVQKVRNMVTSRHVAHPIKP